MLRWEDSITFIWSLCDKHQSLFWGSQNMIKALPVQRSPRVVKAMCGLWHLQLYLLQCYLKLKQMNVRSKKKKNSGFRINRQLEFASNG